MEYGYVCISYSYALVTPALIDPLQENLAEAAPWKKM